MLRTALGRSSSGPKSTAWPKAPMRRTQTTCGSRLKRNCAASTANVMDALKEADRTLPKTIGSDNEDRDQVLDDLTRDVLGPDASPEEKQHYKESVQDLPVILESVDFPGNSFIDVKHLGHQVIVRLNTRHRFYRQLWLPLRELGSMSADEVSPTQAIAAGRQAVGALTLMITAYAKSEGMNPKPGEAYGELRNHWGAFLETLLTRVQDILAA